MATNENAPASGQKAIDHISGPSDAIAALELIQSYPILVNDGGGNAN